MYAPAQPQQDTQTPSVGDSTGTDGRAGASLSPVQLRKVAKLGVPGDADHAGGGRLSGDRAVPGTPEPHHALHPPGAQHLLLDPQAKVDVNKVEVGTPGGLEAALEGGGGGCSTSCGTSNTT